MKMADLKLIDGKGSNSSSNPTLGDTYWVAEYFKSNKRGDSDWQQSISHIYPRFKFHAPTIDEAIKKAQAYANHRSGENVGYELEKLYQVQEVDGLPSNWVVDTKSVNDKLDDEFQPF